MSDAASQGADAGIGALRRTLSIANKRGLHARAAAKFVRTAGQFDAVIRVSFKGQEVSGLSIMGLMMLAAGIGSEIELSLLGPPGRRGHGRPLGPGREQVRRGLRRRACGVIRRPRDLRSEAFVPRTLGMPSFIKLGTYRHKFLLICA